MYLKNSCPRGRGIKHVIRQRAQFVWPILTGLCLFVLGFSSHSRIFHLIWRRHHNWQRAVNFDLCSAFFIGIEQWGFFGVPYLLWQGASVYNGHLLESVTLTPIVERLAVELSLPVFKTVAAGIRTPNLPLATALTHCATAVVPVYVEDILRDSFLPKKCFPIRLGRGPGELIPGKIWSPHPIYKKLV